MARPSTAPPLPASATQDDTGWSAEELAARGAVAVDLLRVLAHPVRLQVAYLLLHGERSVGDLATSVQVSYSAMSQHLNRMLAIHAVTRRRHGTTIFYSLLDNHVAPLTLEVLNYAGHVLADTDHPPTATDGAERVARRPTRPPGA